MRTIAVLFLLALPVGAANLPCTITIDAQGNASSVCAGSPLPPIPTTPVPLPPPPPPASVPAGGNAVMKLAGTNNFPSVRDGEVLVYPLPGVWPDGAAVTLASVQFASSPGRNPVGATYEVAFSPVPGDFTYYKNATVAGNTPCGIVWGPDFTLAWSTQFGAIDVCKIDNRQWYMNYRVIGCPAGQLCGQTFYVPRG